MSNATEEFSQVRHYFVDEAGDPTLFDRKGHVIVGRQGCSRFFMLGMLHIEDPDSLDQELTALRQKLLADAYFKGVPSMQPQARKTAIAFHAKDDLAEVRREVSSVLLSHRLRFFAVVKEKQKLAQSVLMWHQQSETYRYRPNDLYDQLVSRLFTDQLHKADEFIIQFARRGASDRTASLHAALEKARARFKKKWNIVSNAPMTILAGTPAQATGLQAADYLLWVLQRFYERGESRFLELMWPAFRLVVDVDDTRKAKYGAYYGQKNPLTLEVLKKRMPGI